MSVISQDETEPPPMTPEVVISSQQSPPSGKNFRLEVYTLRSNQEDVTVVGVQIII